MRSIPRGASATVLAAIVLLWPTGCGAPTHTPSITLDPIDVSSYASAPCTLLTPQRATRRHLQPPGTAVTGAPTTTGTPDNGTEPGCRWNPTGPRFPSITANATTTMGLSDLHRSDFSYFQPTKIAGYPAVQTATGPGAPHAGHCTVRVGVADHSQIDVTADYPGVTHANAFSADPCADATTLATEIVDALASGAP